MDFPPPIGVIIDGHWRPGIGDPTPLGWMTVIAYLAASLTCFHAAATQGLRTRRGASARRRSGPCWASSSCSWASTSSSTSRAR